MKSFRTKAVTAVAVAAMALSCMGCLNTKVAEGKNAASGIVEQIHEASEKVGKKVSVKLTDIPADEVSASDGYATLVKEKDYGICGKHRIKITKIRCLLKLINEKHPRGWSYSRIRPCS